MGCFLDGLRAFDIDADQWMTAAQDKGKWRKTVEQGVERFMAKWFAAEKVRAGLRHAVECPNVTGRTKDRIAQSKRFWAGSLAISSGRFVCRCHVVFLWCYVCFVFCIVFVFVFMFLVKPRPFVQSFFDKHEPRQPHAVT